ncbi:MAG: methionyl-tRNA formyltransferase [Micrococcaceae bacterium]
MKILFAGTPEVAVPALQTLLDSGNEVVGVLTRPDVPLGRKKVMTASPIAQLAESKKIPVIKATKITDEVLQELTSFDADLAVVVAYGALIPQKTLAAIENGWINIHFSLLPKYRGAAPAQRAIMAGDTKTGVSIFELEAGMDTGPLYAQWEVELHDDITSGELLETLAEDSTDKLLEVIGDIAAGKKPKPQTGEATKADKLTIEDAHIDFNKEARLVQRQINGVTPEPGAWALLDEKRFKIHKSKISVENNNLAAGKLEFIAKKPAKLLVGAATGPLELLEVQPFGKKRMNATDYARGADLTNKVLT